MKKSIIVLSCLFLGACFGASVPSAFYTLTPEAHTVVSDKATVSVGVDRVSVARYLDRPQMLTQTANGSEVALSETNRWIAPLSDLIGRVLAEDIAYAMPNAVVKEKTQGRESFDYLLTADVTSMNTVLGDTASLEAWFMLQNNEGKIVARQAVREKVAVGKTYADMAAAQSELLNRLAQKIAEKIVSHPE